MRPESCPAAPAAGGARDPAARVPASGAPSQLVVPEFTAAEEGETRIRGEARPHEQETRIRGEARASRAGDKDSGGGGGLKRSAGEWPLGRVRVQRMHAPGSRAARPARRARRPSERRAVRPRLAAARAAAPAPARAEKSSEQRPPLRTIRRGSRHESRPGEGGGGLPTAPPSVTTGRPARAWPSIRGRAPARPFTDSDRASSEMDVRFGRISTSQRTLSTAGRLGLGPSPFLPVCGAVLRPKGLRPTWEHVPLRRRLSYGYGYACYGPV